MKKPRSLRTMILIGLVLLNLAVIAGITATVYARTRRVAHDALHDDLRLRARTIAGLLELTPDSKDGIVLELPPRVLPEYMARNSGTYAVIYDASGKARRTSPSLGTEQTLLATSAWEEKAFHFAELAAGPDGIPCASVTYSFLAEVEGPDAGDDEDDEGDWTPPTEEERHFQAVIAADSRPRDAALAGTLAFLLGIGALALVVTTLGGLVVAQYVLRPIARMTAEAAQLTPADTSRRLEPEATVSELHSLAETLNSGLDRLGNALESQRRFASDASHELRTPLAILLGNADLLLRRDRTLDEYRKGLERQKRIAQRMSRITDNLLALARSDAGQSDVEHGPVELGGLTRGVCDELEPLARAGDVSLACRTNGAVVVEGDETDLAGLLQNLVANAVKFTPPGGDVRVSVARNGKYAILEVADTGPGIPAEQREAVFDRFHRVHEGKDQREGAGLGLAIVDWIVKAHDGKISIESEVGRGTTFDVRLPLAEETASTP